MTVAMTAPWTATSETATSGAPGRARPSGSPPPGRCRSDVFEFGTCLGAVSSARRRTREALAEWDLDELADDAVQIVSELMANAVEAHQRERLDDPIRLTLLADLRTALIVVRDASSRPPVLDNPDFDSENGRGLLIVDALAAWRDVKPCAGGGKAVRVIVRGRRGTRPQPTPAPAGGREPRAAGSPAPRSAAEPERTALP